MTTSVYNICRFCFNTNEEKDVDIVNENIIKMLGTLLIEVDLTISECPLICKTCRIRLEENYNFKERCTFIETSIQPFVKENVKLNLNEIRNQIIKSEETDNDTNTCRLCLNDADNMTLNSVERHQFQKYFPEINLNLTSFIVLCSACYEFLQKYFIFVTSNLELEEQLSNYSLDQTNQNDTVKLEKFQQFIRNLNQQDEKKVNLLNEELDIKCEEAIDGVSVKLEHFGQFITTADKRDEKKVNLLNGELDIKSEEDSNDEKWAVKDPSKSSISNTAIGASDNCYIELQELQHVNHGDLQNDNFRIHPKHANNRLFNTCSSKPDSDIKLYNSKESIYEESKMYSCEDCSYQSKIRSHLKKHILSKHTDPSQIKMYECEWCEYKSKFKSNLRQHHQLHHLDASQLRMYKCTECGYKTKHKHHLKSHIQWRHTDPSLLSFFECQHCSYKSKQKHQMTRHVLFQHTMPSEVTMFKCTDCSYETKNKYHLKQHAYVRHADSSNIKKHKCKECDYESKFKGPVTRHELIHCDLSTIQMPRCDECNVIFKHKINLRQHIRRKHSSKAVILKCQECPYQSNNKTVFKKHQQVRHGDCVGVKKYECDQCNFTSMYKGSLTKHVMLKHTDASQIKLYKCETCNYETKLQYYMKKHMSKHTDP